MSTHRADHSATPGNPAPSVEELFRDAHVVRSADDLAVEGLFEPGEVEAFIDDLYAMRRTDLA